MVNYEKQENHNERDWERNRERESERERERDRKNKQNERIMITNMFINIFTKDLPMVEHVLGLLE